MAKPPMNKFLKFALWAAGIFIGVFMLLLIAAAIIIPIVLPPAKLKSIATDKLTAALKHKVSIGDVHFNVLSGFSIKNLVVANRVGWAAEPMVAAKDISISYHLLPLIFGKVSLGEIRLNSPDILVERRNGNQFNFSDMTGASAAQAAPAPAPKAVTKAKSKSKAKKKHKKSAWAPAVRPEPEFSSFFADSAWADTASGGQASKSSLNLSVDSINIQNAHLEYLDETVSPMEKSVASDLNVKVKNVSLDGGKITFSIVTPFIFKKTTYQFSLDGSLHYFLSSQSIKGLVLNGSLNDQGFNLSGDALNMSTDLAPTMDGEASLNTLKFFGLIPSSLYQMPRGLTLSGPAKVDFHLAGSKNAGLELSGTADGSQLVIQYKDMFVKSAKTSCTVDFKSVNKLNEGIYDLPSFKVVYAGWEVTGSFHYAGTSWSCKVHSDSLPFKGLPGMLPKLSKTTIDGGGSLNLSFVSTKGKTLPFLVNGQINLKDVGISLPQEPYLQSMTGVISCADNVVRVPGITFKGFDGTGVMGVTFNGNTYAYNYGFRLTNVNAQKAVDASIDAYVTTKDFTKYKDMLYGTMNFAYSGAGKGFSGDPMMASQVGSGNYSLDNAKLKGDQVKTITKFFKDDSGEISFEQIKGNLGMKNKVFSYTGDTSGKLGAFHENGGIEVVNMVYSPDMTIHCDLKKEFLNSDAVQAAIPDGIKSIVNPIIKSGQQLLDCISDDNGNVPLDVKFTGKVADNNYSYDWTRDKDNALKKGSKALQNAAQPVIQNLGNQLKGLFH